MGVDKYHVSHEESDWSLEACMLPKTRLSIGGVATTGGWWYDRGATAMWLRGNRGAPRFRMRDTR